MRGRGRGKRGGEERGEVMNMASVIDNYRHVARLIQNVPTCT